MDGLSRMAYRRSFFSPQSVTLSSSAGGSRGTADVLCLSCTRITRCPEAEATYRQRSLFVLLSVCGWVSCSTSEWSALSLELRWVHFRLGTHCYWESATRPREGTGSHFTVLYSQPATAAAPAAAAEVLVEAARRRGGHRASVRNAKGAAALKAVHGHYLSRAKINDKSKSEPSLLANKLAVVMDVLFAF